MVRRPARVDPAYLLAKDGDNYRVRLSGPDREEATVTGENVRHLFAGNPSRPLRRGM